MKLSLEVWDYVVVALMLLISCAVGVFFRFTGGKQKTTHEFLMAGKDTSLLPVAFSLMATYMSAISVLGQPAETYMYGTQFVMWTLMMPIGAAIVGYMFLPVFFDMKAATAYEYLEKRFGKTTRSVTSVLFIVQMILYMAVVLYAPSLALNAVTGLPTWASVISLSVVCTFYCSLGGLKAVLWTDVIQSFLMYFTIISVVVKGIIDIGGFQKSMDIASKGGRLIFLDTDPDITKRYTLWNVWATGLLFSVSSFGANQAQVQRMLSLRSLRRSQRALFLSIPLTIVFNVFCVWDGAVIYAYLHDCDPLLRPDNTLTSPDQLLPYSVLSMFSGYPGLSGLCIAGVFGASLSTISSAVNSLTAVTIEDFIRPFCFCKCLSEHWMAFMAKIIAIGYGVLCLLLTFIVASFRGVMEASNIMFGMIGGPVLGVFTLGMFTTTANEKGTLFGLLIGFLFNAWMGFGSWVAKVKIPHLPRSIDGCPNVRNETLSFFLNETSKVIVVTESEQMDTNDSDVFPLYKMSFLWFAFFGTLTVIVVGYISSFIIGYFSKEEKKRVTPEVISPPLRKWFFDAEEKAEKSHNELQDVFANGEVKKIKKKLEVVSEVKY